MPESATATQQAELDRWDTTLSRGAAALLIVNSHMESFYPLSWAAAGGQIGNIIFFMVSGLGLGLSKRTSSQPFLKWYWRRLTRIYPTVWICLIPTAVVLNGGWRTWGPTDYFTRLIWPIEGYHFLTKILIFYVVLYWLLLIPRRWKPLSVALVVTFVASLVAVWATGRGVQGAARFRLGDISEAFKYTFYFSTFLSGTLLGRNLSPGRRSPLLIALAVAVLGVIYVALKCAIVLKQWFVDYYAVLYYESLLLCLGLLLLLSHPALIGFIGRSRAALVAANVVGAASLELYLIHFELIRFGMATWFVFPLNAIVFVVLSVLAAVLVSQAKDRLAPWLIEKCFKGRGRAGSQPRS